MDVLLGGRRPRLSDWKARAFAPGSSNGWRAGADRNAFERVVGKERPGEPREDGVHRRLAEAILRYDVFPPALVTPELERVPLDVGDTVGVLYHLVRGVDLFFACRVVARFDERAPTAWRTGFTYRTLEGHPEAGEETISVEKDLIGGTVVVALRSWSRPGTRLTRAFAPLVRRLQVRANRAALDHLQSHAG